MGKYASEIVEQARKWIGKKESDGTHRSIIDVYNAHKPLARNYAVKYSDNWCAAFVSAVAIKCGYTSIIPTECGCEEMINLFKVIGVWVENDSRTPCAGDVIFYDWDDSRSGDNKGWSDHVGIVEKVVVGKITVIEGNYSDSVKRRTLSVNGKYIRGYGVPRYDSETTNSTKKAIDVIAKEVLAGKWGNGDVRKAALKKAGYDYEAVQEKVNQLAKGTSEKKPITEIAKEVIAGKWGNGVDRSQRLKQAGYNPIAVQKEVNKLF